MKARTRRFLSLMLASAMVLSQVSATALAEEVIIIEEDGGTVDVGNVGSTESLIDDIVIETETDDTPETEPSSNSGDMDGGLMLMSVEEADDPMLIDENGEDLTQTAEGEVKEISTCQFLKDALGSSETTLNLKLTESFTVTETLVIPEGMTVTLDLNGKALTASEVESEAGKHIYAFNNKGTFTLKDTVGTGSVTARGIYNNGTMIVESGTYTAMDNDGGAGVFNYADLTVNGGTFEGYVGLNNRSNATMVINNATVNGSNQYAVQNNGGKLTINNADVNGVFGAVGQWELEGNAPSTVIYNGEFTMTGVDGNSSSVIYVGAGELTIKGGSFAKVGDVDLKSEGAYTVTAEEGSSVEIFGGSFRSVYNDATGLFSGDTSAFTVKGGTYTGFSGGALDVTSYVASGYEVNADGTVVKSAPTYAATIGETEYATLADAIEAAGNGAEIVLAKDITAEGAVSVSGKTLTIDLNQCKLTLSAGGNYFNNGANVTIENGTIDITGVTAKGDCIIGIGDYGTNGTLTLDNINVTGNGYSSAYAVFYVYGTSTLNINGGSVVVANDSASGGGVFKACNGANGIINIIGTEDDPVELTFTDAKIGILDGTVTLNCVDLDITGGANAINQSALTVKNSNLTIMNCAGRALTLYDGNVTIENSILDFSGATEGEIRFKANLELSLVNSTLEECDVWTDVAGATVNGEAVTGLEDNTSTVTVNGETTTVVNPSWAAVLDRAEEGKADAYYMSLADAVAAAEDGDTVILQKNVETSEILLIGKAITLDGNNCTLASSAGRAINIETTGSVVIRDLEIIGSTGCERGVNVINQAANVTLENLTVSNVSHYAVHVATSAGAVNMTISESNLTGYAALAVYGAGTQVTVTDSNLIGINIYADNGSNDYATIATGAADVMITVTGGSVSAQASADSAAQTIYGANDNTGSNVKVTLDTELKLEGENVSYIGWDPEEDIVIAVRAKYADALKEEGYAATASTDNTDMIVVASVAEADGIYYNSLQEAVNAGGEVKLLKDIELAETVTVAEDNTVTLDLNGKTITVTETFSGRPVTNNGTLTVTGDGTIDASVAGNGYGAINNWGTLVIENGTYKGNAASDGSSIRGQKGSTVTINGGTYTGATRAVSSDADSLTTINGGTFNTDNGYYVYAIYSNGTLIINDADVTGGHGAVASDSGNITINGGTFTNTFSSHAVYVGEDAETTINGGTFNGYSCGLYVDNGKAVVKGGTFDGNWKSVYSTETASIEVSGGTFVKEISEDYCAEGFKPEKNTDGTWSVVEGLKGEGTEESPYRISSLNELKLFRDSVNAGNDYSGKYVTVTAKTIDLAGEEWEPIGYLGKTFKGTFDGNGCIIQNLMITKTTENTAENNGIGLFGRTDSPAVIQNLTIENVTITGSLYVGAVVGLGYTGSKIENVTVQGDIAINAWWYAGVIGGNGYMATVNNCHVIGNAGSYVKGNNGSYIGGIWGFRGEGANKITNCTVTNLNIIGVDRVGGICGIGHYGNTISGCELKNVTITATDENATTVGLIVGACEGTQESPTTFRDNTVAEKVTAKAGETPVTVLYGTNIKGGVPVTNYVAEINGTVYESLQTAVEEVQNGETITILRDFTIAEGANGTENAISDESGKSYTIDLNEHTISADTGNAVLRFKNQSSSAAVVTVTNGTLKSGENTWCTVVASAGENGKNITLNMSDLTLENNKGNAYAVKIFAGATANMTDCTVNSNYGGGVQAAGGEVVLTNVTVNQLGLWTAPYNSMAAAVSNGGTMTINSGSYTAQPLSAADGNNQGTTHGSWAAGIMNSGGTMIINGGTFTNGNYGDDSAATSARSLFTIGALGTDTESVLEINGGLFNSIGDLFFRENSTGTEEIAVYGGVFNKPVPEDACGDSYVPVDNGDGTYGVKIGTEALLTGSKTAAYETLAKALKAAKAGDKITLLGNVTTSEVLKISKSITIDGNGYSVTGSAKKVFEVHADAKFTDITINNLYTDANGRCIDTRVGGITLTLDDVTLNANTGGYNQQPLTIGGNAAETGAITVNITDSELNASDSGYAIIMFNPVEMTIENSSLNGYAALYFRDPLDSVGSNGSVVSVIGSELKGTGIAFGTIVFEDKNITVTTDEASTVTNTGSSPAVVFSNRDGLKSDSTTEGNNVVIRGTIDAPGVVSGWASDVAMFAVQSEYAQQLDDQDYVMVAAEEAGMIMISGVKVEATVDGVEYSDLNEALQAAVAAGGDVVVEIMTNIDLSRETWTPVYFDSYSSNNANSITINGNNMTITGLSDMLFSGVWTGTKLEINNLTLDQAKIENDVDDVNENVGVGAFVGSVDSIESVVLNNCHLTNSTVSGGHWTGGLIGYATGYSKQTDGPVFTTVTVNGCSVKNSNITGKGSVGGVVGHATGSAWTQFNVEDTMITGNTISSTGDAVNKAGIVMGTIGAAGQEESGQAGGVKVSVTETGNTVTSNGTTITTVYGRQGSETGVLTITGGNYRNCPVNLKDEFVETPEGYVIGQNEDGTWGLQEEKELFDIYGANVTLGNSLNMNFYVEKADLDGTDYYAVLTRTYADGRADEEIKIAYADWESYNSTLLRFTYAGIAAKEMTDEIYITIYNNDGVAVSNQWEDSLKDYAMRALKGSSDDETKTLVVDMLNYGAEAQRYFDSYNIDELANAELTEEQQAYATDSVSYENKLVKGDNYVGSTISLKSNILLTMYFNNITTDMIAKVTFIDHYGNDESVEISGSEFVARGSMYGVDITTMAVADGRQMVTCEIYDGEELVASASDSIESYAARASASAQDPLYEQVMKFVTSAYNKFH